MKEDAAVVEFELGDRREPLGEAVTEGCFGETGEDVVAPAHEFAEHDVSGGNPFHDKHAGGEIPAELGNVVHGHVIVQKQVMNHGQHKEAVELARAALKEASGFCVAPAIPSRRTS